MCVCNLNLCMTIVPEINMAAHLMVAELCKGVLFWDKCANCVHAKKNRILQLSADRTTLFIRGGLTDIVLPVMECIVSKYLLVLTISIRNTTGNLVTHSLYLGAVNMGQKEAQIEAAKLSSIVATLMGCIKAQQTIAATAQLPLPGDAKKIN